MKLLPRLYRIEEGNIYIDNYDISKVELHSLRKQIGMVPQDYCSKDRSLKILLNDPTADDEDIIKAASIACARIHYGSATRLSSQVAERGSELSGGQRQESP